MPIADADPIRSVEIAAARAWPASRTAAHAGWLLRATPGVGRARSNSALPPPQGGSRIADLDHVIAWYRARGLRPCVMASPLERHGRVDAELGRRGWTTVWEVDVLVAPLPALAGGAAAPVPVTLLRAPGPAWLAAWAACEGRAAPDVAAQAVHVLASLGHQVAYALAGRPGAPAGVGLGVTAGAWCGIFAMATHPEARRGGVASAILRALAEHARQHGADGAYLQVTTANAPAQALYRRLGFARSHGYRTRVAPPAPGDGPSPA